MTDRVFENPQNGYRETVSDMAWLWTLLFGGIYLAICGLWGHFFIMVGILILTGLLFPPLYMFVVPGLWIGYAIGVGSILTSRYQRLGWHEVQPGSVAGTGLESEASRQARLRAEERSRAAAPTVGAPVAPPASASPALVADELVKLVALRDQGVLSADEFAAQKARLLASTAPPSVDSAR